MHYNGAQIIIHLLEQEGITTIAGIPGGTNLPLYDALHRSTIRHVLARHEQGAGFIAQGMARATGKPAVCFATSGPGTANILTAVADAKLDSVPIIIITGQVPLGMIGTDAFQEVDTIGMSLSITKHNFLIRSARDLLTVIPEAFRIAVQGRPGPVLIDVPKDIQLQRCEIAAWPASRPVKKHPSPTGPAILQRIVTLIESSERPLLLIGGGVIRAEAADLVRQLSHKNSIPATATLMGLGAMADDDPLFLGMLGMHGAASTNRLLQACDLLIACGTRFDDRATGATAQFCPDAKIIHIDIDPSEFGKLIRADLAINADCGETLRAIVPLVVQRRRSGWLQQIAAMQKTDRRLHPTGETMPHPSTIIRSIGLLAPPDAIITTDVGQHQMWVAQHYPFRRPRTLLSSGGLGTMGFGLPAAIGAALAFPGRDIICFTGDGSLLMNIQELATLAELDLNVKIVLFNNRQLGLVYQQQEFFYDRNFIASRFTANPDFTAVAHGFGINAASFTDVNETASGLARFLQSPGPALISIDLHQDHRVLPMVPPGAPNHQMIEEYP